MKTKVVVIQTENLLETITSEVITDLPIEHLHKKREESKRVSYEGMEITIGNNMPNYPSLLVNVFNTGGLTDKELEEIMKAVKTMDKSISEIFKKKEIK